jgi:hypothetical protein
MAAKKRSIGVDDFLARGATELQRGSTEMRYHNRSTDDLLAELASNYARMSEERRDVALTKGLMGRALIELWRRMHGELFERVRPLNIPRREALAWMKLEVDPDRETAGAVF